MAKSTKTKVEKKVAETETDITTSVEKIEEVEKKKEEPEEVNTTTPISLVEETKTVEELPKPPVKEEFISYPTLPEKTFEERITDFLDSREGEIKMNDFLKSLYPVPMYGVPPEYNSQGSSRYLRKVLEDLQAAGKVTIVNNAHRRLGEHYYNDGNGQAAKHNISTIQIVVKK